MKIKDKLKSGKVVELFSIINADNGHLFKKSNYHKKYFEWYLEGITKSEVERIYNNYGLNIYNIEKTNFFNDQEKQKESTESRVYEIDEDKLLETNPNDVTYFLSLLESVNGEAFLSLFNYFSHKLDENKLLDEQIKLLAKYLYDIKVFCSTSNDKEEDLPIMAKCTARKLILEKYIDSKHIQKKIKTT